MFAVNYKDNEIISYAIDAISGDTTFPRGTWLVDRDFIITGIKTRKEAQRYLEKDPFNIKKGVDDGRGIGKVERGK